MFLTGVCHTPSFARWWESREEEITETTACFNCFPHPIGEGEIPTRGHGDGQMHNTQHWTREINNHLSVTCAHSLREGGGYMPDGVTWGLHSGTQ